MTDNHSRRSSNGLLPLMAVLGAALWATSASAGPPPVERGLSRDALDAARASRAVTHGPPVVERPLSRDYRKDAAPIAEVQSDRPWLEGQSIWNQGPINPVDILLAQFLEPPLPGDEDGPATLDDIDQPAPRLPRPPRLVPSDEGDSRTDADGWPGTRRGEQPELVPTPGAEPPSERPPARLPAPAADTFPDFTSTPTPADSFVAPQTQLASVPDMFGDSFFGSPTLSVMPLSYKKPRIKESVTDLPLAGGANRLKIGENNSPLPQCRFFFAYDHFRNAFQTEVSGLTATGAPISRTVDSSLDRYTLGAERAFGCGRWSAEVRMPFVGIQSFDFARPPLEPAGVSSVRGGEVGNLALIFKHLIFANDCSAAAWGVGFEFPTGSNAHALVESVKYTVSNDAVYISPYLALLNRPTDRLFLMAFAQLNIPTSSNAFRFQEDFVGGESGQLGELTEQTLLYLDFSAGFWIYRNDCATLVKGVAPIFEVHYTSALEQTDVVSGYVPTFSGDAFDLRFPADDVDVFNLTVMLHFELGRNTALRVGGILPLGDERHRFFDAEFAIQLTKFY